MTIATSAGDEGTLTCEVNPAVGDVPLPIAAAQGAEAHQGPRAPLPGDS